MENKTRTPWEKIRSMTDGQLRKLFARFVNLSDEQIGQIIDQVLEPEVKNCPFCGEKGMLAERIVYGPKSCSGEIPVIGLRYRFYCPNIECSGNHHTYFETEEEALERWNRRAGSERDKG